MFDHTNLSIEKRPKLVRDKIPEIIEKNENVIVLTKTLSTLDYKGELIRKIHEEADELELGLNENSNPTEELADILELVSAAAKLAKSNLEEIQKIRLKKLKIRGGFSKRILLVGKKPKF